MTTTTLPNGREQTLVVTKFASALGLAETKLPGSRYEKFDTEAGHQGMRLYDVAVFRSGEFADSLGDVKVWSDLDIQQIANNFTMLHGAGILDKVPVRCDHFSIFSGGLAGQIGYHENVRAEVHTSPVDGNEYTYLMADLVILRQDAVESILSGLWSNRSAEIGPYSTNYSNGESRRYEPVLLGTAFVDIPAVEGLTFAKKEASAHAGSSPTIIMEESMGATAKTPAANATGDNDQGGTKQHSAPRQPTFEFRVGTDTTSDFAAVQRHIDSQAETIGAQNAELIDLRAFKSEALTRERTDYVEGLKSRNLITGPQAEKFSKLVLTMDAEGFEMFKSAYADAEPNALLENYAPANNVAPGASADTPGSQAFAHERDKEADEESILRAQVRMHAMGGTKASEIEKFDCFAKLRAIHPELTVNQIIQGK